MTETIMRYEEFIQQVIAALNAAGVAYMVGGAVAVWAWGEPRSTMNLEMAVDIPVEAIGLLSTELKKRDMLVPAEIILDSILEDRADMPINAIHMYSGYKADLYPLRAGDELRSSAFERRVKIDLGEPIGEIWLHSPEDLIIYKLWYFSLSQQTKHVRDISSIVMTLGKDLDYAYIEHWAEIKGIGIIWQEMLKRIRR